ncbi:hypothetical protein C0995_004826, partial [Termitomyces sp. Mi166
MFLLQVSLASPPTYSNSNEEEEERVCVMKKIKCKHIEEPIGMSKKKETIELQATVVPKMPMAGPLHQTLKPIVLISGTPNLAPKPTAAMPVPQPAPVKSAEESGVLIINQATEVVAGNVTSTVTQETLQSKEDTGNKNDNDEGRNNNKNDNDDDDDSDDDNDAIMDVDSGSLDAKISKTLHPEETQQKASTKVMVTDDVALAP